MDRWNTARRPFPFGALDQAYFSGAKNLGQFQGAQVFSELASQYLNQKPQGFGSVYMLVFLQPPQQWTNVP